MLVPGGIKTCLLGEEKGLGLVRLGEEGGGNFLVRGEGVARGEGNLAVCRKRWETY